MNQLLVCIMEVSMDTKTYLEWLQRQGHHIYQSQSSYWYDAGPRVVQAFPHHKLIKPSEQELNKLLIKNGLLALRYSLPVNSLKGMASYHVVLHEPYDFESLPRQARSSIKKGMNNFQVQQIPFERLAEEGWVLQQDTLDRQGRLKSMNQSDWRKICLSASGLPGFEAWSAISFGELAAAQIIARVGNTACVPYAICHRKFLRDHVNNVLFFTVSKDLLSRSGITNIFYCLHSLDAPTSVDQFKNRMNLLFKPVLQRVKFHPLLSPFINLQTYQFIQGFSIKNPNSSFFAKAEGMARFYLNGKKPLDEQEWPEFVSQHKEKIIDSLSKLSDHKIVKKGGSYESL